MRPLDAQGPDRAEALPNSPAPKESEPKETASESETGRIMKLSAADALKLLTDPASSRFQKSKACMRLSMVADRNTISALAALLGDPKYNHYARFALVPIEDSAVDDALRAALSTLEGSLLIGVIDSIGERKDAGAVEALTAMIYKRGIDAARASAAALGRIDGPEATAALLDALAKTRDSLQSAVASACLARAEDWLARGNRDEAVGLYRRLTQPDIPRAVRFGAMQTLASLEAPGGPLK